jgi:hypothetical protein
MYAGPGTRTPGVAGGALYFDGTTGAASTYVHVPDAPSLHIAGGITMAAWVRCEDLVRDAPILAKEDYDRLSYWFGVYGVDDSAPGSFGGLLDRNGLDPWELEDRNQGAVSAGVWTHLATTWDGATVRHYLDGEALPETHPFTGPLYVADTYLAIGVNSQKHYTAFKGAVDDVRLYNYALGPDAVRALYTTTMLSITDAVKEGDDLRVYWTCGPGQRYQVQTNAGLVGAFHDLGTAIVTPTGTPVESTNYLHRNALMAADGVLFYRVQGESGGELR